MAEQKADISYPTPWGYKIIGEDVVLLAEIAEEVMGDKSFTMTEGNVSSSGKYQTLSIDTVVFSEEERITLFDSFKSYDAVKVVL